MHTHTSSFPLPTVVFGGKLTLITTITEACHFMFPLKLNKLRLLNNVKKNHVFDTQNVFVIERNSFCIGRDMRNSSWEWMTELIFQEPRFSSQMGINENKLNFSPLEYIKLIREGLVPENCFYLVAVLIFLNIQPVCDRLKPR